MTTQARFRPLRRRTAELKVQQAALTEALKLHGITVDAAVSSPAAELRALISNTSKEIQDLLAALGFGQLAAAEWNSIFKGAAQPACPADLA